MKPWMTGSGRTKRGEMVESTFLVLWANPPGPFLLVSKRIKLIKIMTKSNNRGRTLGIQDQEPPLDFTFLIQIHICVCVWISTLNLDTLIFMIFLFYKIYSYNYWIVLNIINIVHYDWSLKNPAKERYAK